MKKGMNKNNNMADYRNEGAACCRIAGIIAISRDATFDAILACTKEDRKLQQ